MRKSTICILFLFLYSGCQQDYSFQNFHQNFQEAYRQQFQIPSEPLIIITKEKIDQDVAFCTQQLELLANFNLQKLNPENQAHWEKMEIKLKKKITQIQAYQTHPDRYNIRPALQNVLEKTTWEEEKKLSAWQEQLVLTPLFYRTARRNLQAVDVKNAKLTWEEHIDTFIFLDQTLPDLLKQSTWTNKQKKDFLEKLDDAKIAVKDYIAFCRSAVLNSK